MSFSNSGGLLTRGYGKDHRIVTRGMGKRFDFGGIRPRILKEYSFGMFAPILKEISFNVGAYVPVRVKRKRKIVIVSSVLKEIESDFNMIVGVDHSKLGEILDSI